MIDYEKLKTRRGLWKKTEQPGYVKRRCAVDGCQTKHYNQGYCAKHYHRIKTHGDPTIVKKRSHPVYDSLNDYLTRNSKKQMNGCWEWTSSKRRRGYGNAGSCEWAKQYNTGLAHRLAYICYKGEFDYTLFVCHHCDNPSCINPQHLFLGTHKENMKDMLLKGRKNNESGEKAANAKLTKDQAIYILRNMETISAWELSTKFNVCRQTIQNVWNGITKYIEPELRKQIIKREYQHEVDIDRCQHESSRILRLSDGGDGLCHYDVKCKKCGEFYK